MLLCTSSFVLGAGTVGDFLDSLCPEVERDLSFEGFDDYDEYLSSSFGTALELASDMKIGM